MAAALSRRRPDAPFPAINAVPERLAEGALAETYADVKAVLDVPWMGVVAMSFAHHRGFFTTLWEGLRPLCASAAFRDACARLTAEADRGAAVDPPSPLRGRLAAMGYDEAELARISALVDVFAEGNAPYLMMATQARLLLEGHALSADPGAPATAPPRAGVAAPPPELIEAHHASADLAAVYDEIREALGLPFLNTDYRALARWPSFFALAWGDLRQRVGTSPHEASAAALHRMAAEECLALPNPGRLAPEAFAAFARDPEVLESVRLFQWLLPGLMTNVAVFRAQLR